MAIAATSYSARGVAPRLGLYSPLGLGAIIVLPILLFAATVGLLLDRQYRLAIDHQLELTARAASAAISLKLADQIATLETVATVLDLADAIGAPALEMARRVLEAESEWLALRLEDPISGRAVAHLGPAPGAAGGWVDGASGESADAGGGAEVRVGGVRLHGIHRPAVPGAPSYVRLEASLARDGRELYRLIALVRGSAFGAVLEAQGFPPGWLTTVFDGGGRAVAHNRPSGGSDEAFGATPLSEDGLEALLARLADVGGFYASARRSPLFGWTTVVAAPAASVAGPLRRGRLIVVASGAGALLLTLGLAGGLLRGAARLREERAALHEREALVRQKDVLLREANHRIKNSLQVIASLINLQAERVAAAEARRELETIARRVRALSLVHEQLRGGVAGGAIDLAVYLDRLCANLLAAHGPRAQAVRLAHRLQPVTVEPDVAVPIGLIVNEAVTNSLKHAFPDGCGTVEVAVAPAGPGWARLEVTDDGVGLAASALDDDAEPGAGTGVGVGLSLIPMLAAQLGGKLEWRRDGGLGLRLRFPV